MEAHKCSFSVYLNNVPVLIRNNSLQLIMYSEPVPFDGHPKYLGVHLDRRLTFNHHTNIIRQKCIKLLNILKCLAYKNWAVSTNEQLMVYKPLIRSCMEYAAPLTILSNANIRLLQGAQYQALRIFYKAPLMAFSTELHLKVGIENIHNRLLGLSKKYVERASKVGNPLILTSKVLLLSTIIFKIEQLFRSSCQSRFESHFQCSTNI